LNTLFGGGLSGLYALSFLSGMAMGIFNPLISIHFEKSGLPETVTGYNAGLYYLALVAGAPLTVKLIRGIGVRAVIASGLILAGVSAMAFPFYHSLPWFGLIRFAMGTGVCLYMVGGQSLLSAVSDGKSRTAISSLHVTCFGLGLGIGPIASGALSRGLGEAAFWAAGGIILLGLPALFLLPGGRFGTSAASRKAMPECIGVALAGVLAYGAMESIMLTLFPVHLLRLHFAESSIGYPLTAFMVGGGIGLVPASYFGDRWGRRKVLAAFCILGFAAILAVPFAVLPPAIIALSLVLGIFFGPMFPLTLAMIGERLGREDLPSGSAWFTASFSLGCALGPPMASHLMGWLGAGQLFMIVDILLAAVLVAMASDWIAQRKEYPEWSR
jgi:MFS family permease